MFLLGLSTLLFIYISQFPACCHEYTGGIYDLEYYYHPPIIFLFFLFPFPFPFFILFYFSVYSIPITIDGVYLPFYQNIFI
jgi:hypothetical protein